MPISGYFDTVFAVSGDLNTIPDATQPSGTVSYTQGFPVGYSTPIASGGFNVPRTAINQALNDITSAIQKYQQNTVAPFITSTMNGGSPYSYPANVLVLSGGIVYQSLAASNTDTPPSSKWAPLYIFQAATQSTTGATHTYATADNALATLRSNSGTLMTDTLPGTSPGVLAKGWSGTIVNNDASALLFISTGAGANLNGSSTGSILLGPSQRCTFFSDGANYWSKDKPGRTKLAANTSFYVATTGSDTTNNGLAVGTPWATIQKAISFLSSSVDLAGFTATVNVADGTYTSGATISGAWVGAGTVVLNGNTTTPANCVISTTSATCLTVQYGANLNIGGFKIKTTTSGYGIIAQYDSVINITGNMAFDSVVGVHLLAQDGGHILLGANYTVTAGATAHVQAARTGGITNSAVSAITVSGTPAFGTAFALSLSGGVLDLQNIVYSGSATGSRYNATLNAVINTNGGGASYFPGNSAGTTATGGQYA